MSSPPRLSRTTSRDWIRRALAGVCAGAVALAPMAAQAQDGRITLVRDAEIEDILRQDADPIIAAAGLRPQDVKIHLVGDKELNAFVIGGQQMFFHTGMIVETKTPNELQGVIAHETAHIAGGHMVRFDDTGRRSAMRTFLVTLGLGVVAALAGSPEAAAGLVYSAPYFATLSVLGYTRAQESRTDQAAATYLDKAGISGKGLVDFFENFRYEEVFSGARRYPYFQSHPLGSERIEALRVRVTRQPHYAVVDTPAALELHKVMIAKLKAFVNYPQQTFQDYPESDKSYPSRYARVIAHYKATDNARALMGVDALIAEYPQNPYLWELKGQILFETGKIKEAEAPQRKALALKPTSSLLRLSLAQTLVATNDPVLIDEAVDHLKKVAHDDTDSAMAWRLLAQAYDFKKLDGMARLAAAEQNYAVGQVDQARVFGMRARELLDPKSPEWRRATDIVLVSNPSKEDLDRLAGGRRQGGR